MSSKFDIYCPGQDGTICPAKAEIVREFTGDNTGETSLPLAEELACILLTQGLGERNRQALLQGCAGPNEENEAVDCPVRDDINEKQLRKTYTKPGRWLLARLVR